MQLPHPQRASAGSRHRTSFRTWQDRIRDPCLTVLLILELCAIFLAAPLAARGLPVARVIGETLVLAVLAIVVFLSHRRGAMVMILFGLAATSAGFALGPESSSLAASVFRRGGNMLTFAALSWVVAHAVYARGRITFHRLQGAAVLYLNLAMIFASAFSLIWDRNANAFANLPAPTGGPGGNRHYVVFQLHYTDYNRIRGYRAN